MKTLVTGASGLVGSSVIRELLSQGRDVRAFTLKGCDMSNIEALKDRIEIVEGDLLDMDSIRSAMKGCDIVYQIAARYTLWAKNPQIFYDINVQGSANVMETALEQGVKKVVYTSSIASVGAYGPENPADENAVYNLWDTGNHYIRSKYLGEQEAVKYYKKGLPVVIVNPTVVTGVRDQVPTPSGKTIVDMLNNNMPAYIDGGINIVDVEDVAKGHVLAELKGRVGERYILGNTNLTLKEYTHMIARLANVDPPKFKMPYNLLLYISYVVELISKITRKEPLVTVSTVKLAKKYMYYDCSKAVNELGLPRTPVEETVTKAIDWFRENGYVK